MSTVCQNESINIIPCEVILNFMKRLLARSHCEKMSKALLVLCSVLVLAQFIESLSVKKVNNTTERKKFSQNYADECRDDLNECLDHSWAHLPDSPPIGYCCEHYNYIYVTEQHPSIINPSIIMFHIGTH
ncbi:uncharacterized protein CDAR_404031 [Caerostris darwini]|uniref:Uncharacterized protein n=1 Tax=Caerostris darwini TaxID=1538125 RepID=A0AAV4SW49_9ARAC|nr:uncharacterized protein CDAR_404031 [Caerostris darwini]